MSKLWQMALGAGLLAGLIGLAPFTATAQDKKAEDPKWKHGMTLRVRKAGEAAFTKETMQVGVEAFHDANSGYLLYIDTDGKNTGEISSISLCKGESKEEAAKAPDWRHAMDLSVRKAGEAQFTKTTKRCGVEVFRDENTGNLIYVCDSGSIAVVPAGAAASGPAPGDKAKEPAWTHGMELWVRKAGEPDFNKDTKKIGVEVFRDENNGNLVYISDTGSIAVVTGVKTEGVKAPDWKYGFEVSARKAGEGEFSKETKRYNIEVFQDINNGNAIYISETGSISVLPNVKVASTEKVKAPAWQYAADLAVRKANEDKFTKETKKYGVEFYKDENDNVMVAITQHGCIAIIPAK
jgi:hypothetical protein